MKRKVMSESWWSWWKAKLRESQTRRCSKGKHRAKDETSAYVSTAYLNPLLKTLCLP